MRWKLGILISIAMFAGCTSDDAGESRASGLITLPDVIYDPRALPYIKREILPFMNELIAALHARSGEYPELSELEPRELTDPFAEFTYRYRVHPPPAGERSMVIEPGGCMIALFLEPFERRTGPDGMSEITTTHARFYRHVEFGNLGIRFNYNMQLGEPNSELYDLFTSLVYESTGQMALKDSDYTEP